MRRTYIPKANGKRRPLGIPTWSDKLLRVGYLEDWTYGRTLSGSPQGGVISPLLANIYLDRLDQYVEQVLIPANTRGRERWKYPDYVRLLNRAKYLEHSGRRAEAQPLRRELQTMPSRDPHDPAYRRLRYVRYADDFLLGFNGPRREAEVIKQQLATFLRDELHLELSPEKMLITHARTTPARFLGYEVVIYQNDRKRDRRRQRAINGLIGLKVPADVVRAHCARYQRRGKAVHRTERMHDTVFSIMSQYQAEYRGVVNYYRLAYNLRVLNRLRWIME